ncbi:MAG TPA: ABC transporter permease [Cyclobacteriaceae bacterium]|nr:ABC transporter permease [Cyclobacteriaceae bacterium]
MIRNYLIVSFRNLLKNRGYTLINIFGLTVGLASVILISLYVADEIGYERYHPDTANIYRIYWQSGNPQTRTPHPMAQALVHDFPEVESAVTLSPIWGPGLTKQSFSVRNLEKDIRYNERDILSVDSTFFDVFPIKIIKGNRKTALRTPGKLMLSESSAKKYFGEEDPIGKFLAVNEDENLIEIEGVYEDIPRQSHFHASALVSYVHMKANEDPESAYYTWQDFGHFNYIKLAPGADPHKLESQLLAWARNYINASDEIIRQIIKNKEGFKLQNIRDIHLKSHLLWELEANGDIEYVYIMTAAAILILIIGTINFLNLTTAKSSERAKEIGIRRTLGAIKSQLSFQFIGESLLVALFAVILGGLAAEVLMPFFNDLSSKPLELTFARNWNIILGILFIGLVIGVIGGLYPSFVLSSIHPVKILKGKFTSSKTGNLVSRIMVLFQFSMAIVLISGTIIIMNQMNFIQNKNLGFSKESTLMIPIRQWDMRLNFETLQTELQRVNGVEMVAASSNVPGTQINQEPIFKIDDPDREVNASQMYIDYDLIKTLGLEIVEGRGFDREFPGDTANAYIINQAAARELQLIPPYVGKEIILEIDDDRYRGPIVGVVKDFNYQSLHQPIRPIVMQRRPWYNTVLLKLNTNDIQQTIADVETVWNKFDDSFGFEYSFLEDTIDSQYVAENKMGLVFGLFASVAIIISCMGLFGLASLNFAQRKKEVGIRKVLGAPLMSLLVNLVTDYSRLIIFATLLAVPVAWWSMRDWLNHFVFKTDISAWTFVLTGLGTLVIAWITIAYLTIHTASLNPVDTLKEE